MGFETPSGSTETTEGDTRRAEDTDALTRGTVVGRYVLLDRLGMGGMGVVYAAYDPELDRKLALKLVAPRADRAHKDRARLLREAQALAKLSHPNVVAIHDVGTHGERVWIAMELVEGHTLGAWARAEPHRWSELLPVLTNVARGVAAAHAVELVHRDLKPDNVMIGHDGRVRVMDFGLAHGRAPATSEREPEPGTQPLDGPSSRPTLAALAIRLTREGAIQGTPGYMAPEQWKGQDAEAAADQFGWSVVAWELLYGERPFAGDTPSQIATSVLLGKRRPPPAGRRVPAWLRRIIERGLALEPSRRWPTMLALVSELERGRVGARRRTIAVGLVVTAALAAGAAGGQQWDHARRVAACEREGAAIEDVWNDDARARLRAAFDATGVSYAATSADKALPWLDERTREWRHARTEACINAKVRGAWSEETLERAVWCLEDLRATTASLVTALARGDATVVPKAVSAVTSLTSAEVCMDDARLRRQPVPPPEDREAIGQVREQIAWSTSLGLAGGYGEALEVATRARERATELEWAPLWATARAQEAEMLTATGVYADGAAAMSEAYFAAARARDWATAAAAATSSISIVGVKLAQPADARGWASHAEVALVQAEDPMGLHEGLRLANLATAQLVAGEYAEARTLYERALAITEAAVGPEHPLLAPRLLNFATLHAQLGEWVEARALYERALAITEAAVGPEHPNVAGILSNLGNTYVVLGDDAHARELYERALRMREAMLGPTHPDVAESSNNLSIVARRAGRFEEARALAERAIAIHEAAMGPDHPAVADGLLTLAAVHQDTGALAEARALLERATSIRERALGPEHPLIAQSLFMHGDLLLTEGTPAPALPLLARALEILVAHHLPDAEARFGLARALLATGGERARALAEAVAARDALRKAGPSEAVLLAEVERWLADHAG